MTDSPAPLIRLPKTCIRPAAQMLARAFQDYPVSWYVYPDAAERQAKLPYTFEHHLRYRLTFKQTFATSPQMEGVAIWRRMDKADPSLWSYVLSGAFLPELKMGKDARHKMRIFSELAEKKHRELVPFNHWFLMLIGVDPKFQGKGYASRLLKDMLARIDEEGLPCYLETQKEVNVSIYQYFGFKVIDEFLLPDSSIKTWPMLREAHGLK